MDTIVCKGCRKLFNYIGGEKLCPNCRSALEDKFQEVKKYLRENPNCSTSELCDECDVPMKQIEKWIQQERLEISSAKIKFYCEKCGNPIVTGRYCVSCKSNLQKDLMNLMPKTQIQSQSTSTKISSKNGMHYLDKKG